ncbi:MAG: LUD domain-containing protein [Terracidiphilus sp.]
MSALVSSRQHILDNIRSATEGVSAGPDRTAAYAALPRDYTHQGQLRPKACVKLIIERLREYDAEVTEATPTELPAAVQARLAASGRHSFVVPPGVPDEWLAAGVDWKIDRGLATAEIEEAEGVLTACSCAIADSGTIVLHHSESEGRRVLSLLPDWHLIVLRASQVVETLPEYFNRFQDPPELITWISGPSATADIEMTRIKGVHGPRFLNVILVHDEPASTKESEPKPAKTRSAKPR